LKIALFWEVTLLSVVSHYQCFTGTCWRFLQDRR